MVRVMKPTKVHAATFKARRTFCGLKNDGSHETTMKPRLVTCLRCIGAMA